MIAGFYTPIILYSIETILNFCTGYYHNGILIMNLLQIIKKNLKFDFWIDIISIFIIY